MPDKTIYEANDSRSFHARDYRVLPGDRISCAWGARWFDSENFCGELKPYRKQIAHFFYQSCLEERGGALYPALQESETDFLKAKMHQTGSDSRRFLKRYAKPTQTLNQFHLGDFLGEGIFCWEKGQRERQPIVLGVFVLQEKNEGVLSHAGEMA